MKQTTQYLRILLLTISLALSGTLVYADPPDDEDPDPSGVPIDGGISLLVGAAAIYGVKKLHDKNKQQKQDEANK
ncbi:MAG: hypothetical protein JST52_03300 [Bacteroidetes bacterium]|nr:hypothetical protein [Bacteroidota bacterium]MBS1739434.1 hypothetical protein [Bacteroidota bacterium]MBS1776486.1 hypothetical protein [Bacteroidota bacterium]